MHIISLYSYYGANFKTIILKTVGVVAEKRTVLSIIGLTDERMTLGKTIFVAGA